MDEGGRRPTFQANSSFVYNLSELRNTLKLLLCCSHRCYAMNSDFMKASHYCSRSCEAVEKAFGSSSVEYAHELHKLSQLLFNDRQVKKALSTIDKATRLLSRHYGRSNPDVKELSEMKRHLIAVGGHSRNNST